MANLAETVGMAAVTTATPPLNPLVTLPETATTTKIVLVVVEVAINFKIKINLKHKYNHNPNPNLNLKHNHNHNLKTKKTFATHPQTTKTTLTKGQSETTN